ncbi:MAG TPA: hypothetical protein VGZ69_03230 [Candidatus Rhabdochlamydia sp.]|jgi:hypothetical protein|nr:hypothetical protein [Candidatus Rhabdochlamydia sp.]
MLNPIKAFSDMNSTIQRITGYSFSLSHIPQNINKVALPAIALAAGMYAAANAEGLPSQCYCSYDDCIALCSEGVLQLQNKDFFHELGKCVRICVTQFP